MSKHGASQSQSQLDSEDFPINLDISALFAFVSALTNGGANFRFREPLLDEQASWERANPVLAKLHCLVKGTKREENIISTLICAEWADFQAEN